MLNSDGTGTCDKCGVALPNTGVLYCVILSGMLDDGSQWLGHFCTFGNDCASQVIKPNVVGRGQPDWFVFNGE